MKVSIQIDNVNVVTDRLRGLGAVGIKALAAAMYQEAEGLITEAKLETPVDTGALRASGHVQLPRIEGSNVEVVCGFGGPAAHYALYVHENLAVHHNVGKAKFLEDPAKRRAPTMAERIAQKIDELTR